MTKRQKRKFTREFFDRCGPNIKMMVSIFEELPYVAFYIKDQMGRIVAINRYNCELCNISNPESAIGKRSSDLFPVSYADFCMARDRTVMETGKPITFLKGVSLDFSDFATGNQESETRNLHFKKPYLSKPPPIH